jgi:S1-C subfamily serine protease
VELREHLKAPNGGALVDDVSPDSPASRAGLKGGDVIVKFGDRTVSRFTDLENAVAATVPGSTVPVEVLRDGKAVRTRITVVERPDEKTLLGKLNPEGNGGERAPAAAPTAVKSRYGLSVQAGNGEGVAVASVAAGSPAQEIGLQQGDVIVEANGKPTPTVEAFQKAINALPADSSVVIRVKGPSGLRYTVIRP